MAVDMLAGPIIIFKYMSHLESKFLGDPYVRHDKIISVFISV